MSVFVHQAAAQGMGDLLSKYCQKSFPEAFRKTGQGYQPKIRKDQDKSWLLTCRYHIDHLTKDQGRQQGCHNRGCHSKYNPCRKKALFLYSLPYDMTDTFSVFHLSFPPSCSS